MNYPKEHPERRNPVGNEWEFHRDDTRYGHPKGAEDTQEIPRQQN
jgi:hypothetical protein